MKELCKNNIFVFLLITSTLFAFSINSCKKSPPAYESITENDIREIMINVENSARNRDIEGVIRYLSPDIVIKISMDTLFGLQTEQWTLTKYKIETENSWALSSSYEYNRENEEITVSDDGKSAIVKTDILEVITVQGQTIRQKTHEKVRIEIIDGKLMVTSIEAYVKT
jgi:hypothetical protein